MDGAPMPAPSLTAVIPQEEDGAILLRQDEGGITTLTLNRPRRRNALSAALLLALEETLGAIGREEAIRCVVIAAAGPAFCAGHDLAEMRALRGAPDGGRTAIGALLARCSRVMRAVTELPQPVIAAVHGMATAAGCQLAAAADITLAAEDARFCTPGVAIGLFCSTPAVALSRAVGRKAALDMLLTGDVIDAAQAQRLGLVSRLCPPAALAETASALAQGIAGRSALALRLGKAGFNAQHGLPLAQAYEHATAVMLENVLSEDAAEGIGAFLERRPPRWQDR